MPVAMKRRDELLRESGRKGGYILMNVKTQISRDVNQVKYKAENAATNRWMLLLARLGYATKGVVYLIIGYLAALLAAGLGGCGIILCVVGEPRAVKRPCCAERQQRQQGYYGE